MEITSVSLRNFKIHADQQFQFQPGINAICGENGAGKTSIIEAVAWVLFNYSDYNVKELVRNGAKSAQAWVNFISHQDGRHYRIYRCTTKGYEIYDPQLDRTLGLKKQEDIFRWLRQQLGISRDLDLKNLFSQMIGIPQGTFTADFLKNGEGRKKVFDPILRVDEYKAAYTNALALKNYSQAQIQQLNYQKEQYELQLADWPELKQRYTQLELEIKSTETQLQAWQKELNAIDQDYQQLQAQAQTILNLSQTQERLSLELKTLEQQLHQTQHQCQLAETAAAQCRAALTDYETYQGLAAHLETLNHQLQARPSLEKQLQQLQAQQQHHQVRLSQAQLHLQTLENATAEIAQLTPLVAQQTHLETELAALNTELITLHQAQTDAATLAQHCTDLDTQLATLTAEIDQLTSLSDVIAAIPAWETQLHQAQRQRDHAELSQALKTELDPLLHQAHTTYTDLEFQIQTAQDYLSTWPATLLGKNTVVTALDQALSAYADLHQRLTDITGGLETSSQEPHQQISHLTAQLQQARTAQAQFATLPLKQTQHTQLQAQRQTSQKQLDTLQTRLTQLPAIAAHSQTLQAQLHHLGNPQAKIHYLQQQLQHQAQWQTEADQETAQIAHLTAQITTLQAQLAALNQLEQERQHQQQAQQLCQRGYQTYLQHLHQAQTLNHWQQQRQDLEQHRQHLHTQLQENTAQLQHLSQTYDPQRLDTLHHQRQRCQSQVDQALGSLPLLQAQLHQLQQELNHRAEIAELLAGLEHELCHRTALDQFILTSRNIFNQSGPRITQYYMSSIVQVADQLLRELLNRVDVALAWTEDYEIRVQEGGHWRGFKSLSGGEQMCAALAVRLALLKVLVEIDIAFFDEPTTNMDAHRRNQLAAALGHLKSFRQLFVISHDDAFETITENIIRVQRH